MYFYIKIMPCSCLQKNSETKNDSHKDSHHGCDCPTFEKCGLKFKDNGLQKYDYVWALCNNRLELNKSFNFVGAIIVNGESIPAISYLYVSQVPKTLHYSYVFEIEIKDPRFKIPPFSGIGLLGPHCFYSYTPDFTIEYYSITSHINFHRADGSLYGTQQIDVNKITKFSDNHTKLYRDVLGDVPCYYTPTSNSFQNCNQCINDASDTCECQRPTTAIPGISFYCTGNGCSCTYNGPN
jgi:hypothetical protein